MSNSNELFAAALGVANPWHVQDVTFDAGKRLLVINIDFAKGSKFPYPGAEGLHPVHDTVLKRYRHLNFFQHECYLEVRTPRLSLPDGRVALAEPEWAGKLTGFTLLFEALVLTMCREMPFAAVARMVGETWHRVHAICSRYVDLALAKADLSSLTMLAIDETSSRRGQNYLTFAADAEARKVVFVTEGRDSKTVKEFSQFLSEHQGKPEHITSVSMDMSAAFIKGVTKHLPNARITFDKFHVVAHASGAVDQMRRLEQKTDPSLKGLRWVLLKDQSKLNESQRADLKAFTANVTTKRTARAWFYREQLREILDRKQINVASALLKRWCTNVNRSKVEPMKQVAGMITKHFDGIIAWAQTRQTNGFLEAINGLFQAAKRRARGYGTFKTMRTVIFLVAGNLKFSGINPHAA
jgi:transposase